MEDNDKFLAEQLAKAGYYITAEELKQRKLNNSEPFRVVQWVDNIEKSQFFLKARGKTQTDGFLERLEVEYDLLFQFYCNSLDMYKPELKSIAYYMFLYTYIDIASYNPVQAPIFYDKYKQEFLLDHNEELKMVNTYYSQTKNNMISPPSISCSAFMNDLTTKKTILSISTTSYLLLLNYLNDNLMQSLISRINNYISFQQYDDKQVKPEQNVPLRKDAYDLLNSYKLEEALAWVVNETEDNKRNIPLPVLRDNVPLLPSIAFVTMLNTDSKVTCMKISKDVQTIAVGTQDSKIHIWRYSSSSSSSSSITTSQRVTDSNSTPMNMKNTNEHEEIPANKSGIGALSSLFKPKHSILIGHTSSIYSLDISNDGLYVISGSNDKTVKLWSVQTSTCLVTYTSHSGPIWSTCFSPKSTCFLSTSLDTTARLWYTNMISPVRIFTGHSMDVTCCAWHPNGLYIATGSIDKSIRFWGIQNADILRLFVTPYPRITALCFHPRGNYLAASTYNGYIYIFNIATGRIVQSQQAHNKSITYLAFSPSGLLLASSSLDYTLKIWQISTLTPDLPSLTHPQDMELDPTESSDPPETQTHNSYLLNDNTISLQLLSSHSTKTTPIYTFTFVNERLITAGGPFLCEECISK
ncbi:hypothetical protein WA158_005293 [Blastocystis sp. Blastoise]